MLFHTSMTKLFYLRDYFHGEQVGYQAAVYTYVSHINIFIRNKQCQHVLIFSLYLTNICTLFTNKVSCLQR